MLSLVCSFTGLPPTSYQHFHFFTIRANMGIHIGVSRCYNANVSVVNLYGSCEWNLSSSNGVLAIPAKVIASCFALMAFACAVIVGWSVQNTTQTILWRAMLAMFVCWLVGYAVGLVAQQVVDRRIENYKAANPLNSDAMQTNGLNVIIEDDQANTSTANSPAVTSNASVSNAAGIGAGIAGRISATQAGTTISGMTGSGPGAGEAAQRRAS